METTHPEAQRVQKIIADSTSFSRRDAERLVGEGSVTVNGKIAKLGDRAIPGKDHIKINGKLLKSNASEQKFYITFFKPRGVFCSPRPTAVPRKEEIQAEGGTIWEYLRRAPAKVRPVGQLDRDAEGVLLLTNDGELSDRLLKSKFRVPRIYSVKVDGHPDPKKIRRLEKGIRVEETRVKVEEIKQVSQTGGKTWFEMNLIDPKTRLIRKLFEAVGHPVDKVCRESFGGVSLKGIKRGEWRYLSPTEIVRLRECVGLETKISYS